MTSDVSVLVGDSECDVTDVADDSIDCTLGDHAGGTFAVQVIVAGKGKASGSQDFEYEFVVESVDPVEG